MELTQEQTEMCQAAAKADVLSMLDGVGGNALDEAKFEHAEEQFGSNDWTEEFDRLVFEQIAIFRDEILRKAREYVSQL